MTKNAMCAESVLPKPKTISGQFEKTAQERFLAYKMFSAAFNYPDDTLSDFFPEEDKEKLLAAYDSLFRASEIWLYGAEYTAENEFQRVKELSDISGFYRAFGLQVDKERPDALSCELEFMHYLIYKELYCLKRNIGEKEEKAGICRDAQKKFFKTHLYPAAKKITEKVILASEDGFYSQLAQSLFVFLESEKELYIRGRKTAAFRLRMERTA